LGEIKMKFSVLVIIIITILAYSDVISNNNAMLKKHNNIYITSDGGKTWKKIVKEAHNQFATFVKNGTKYTTDGGKTWIKEIAQRKSVVIEATHGFSLYPNPLTHENLNIALPQGITGKYFEFFISDLFGRCFMNSNSKSLNLKGNEINLDLKDMTNGSYIFKLQSGDDVYVKIFLINR